MNRRAFLAAAPALGLSACKAQVLVPQEKRAAIEGKTAQLLAAAHAQTKSFVWYDGNYSRIAYPGGDVAPDHGACSDVLVRAYRAIGIDLQKLVHEDMSANFHLYPKKWGLKHPDANIDHRRVPNLMVFFSRFGKVLPLTHDARDYRPGDILATAPVTTHIALVGDVYSIFDSNRLTVIQNIGHGVNQDDALFAYPLLGHYRYGV